MINTCSLFSDVWCKMSDDVYWFVVMVLHSLYFPDIFISSLPDGIFTLFFLFMVFATHLYTTGLIKKWYHMKVIGAAAASLYKFKSKVCSKQFTTVKYAKLLESVLSIMIRQPTLRSSKQHACALTLKYYFCRNLREFVENKWKDWSLSGPCMVLTASSDSKSLSFSSLWVFTARLPACSPAPLWDA